MACESAELTTDFDAREWDRVYSDPASPAINFIFRRSAETALELCRPLIRPGDPWLDAGCGTGRLAIALEQMGARLFAADHDHRMLVFAREHSAQLSTSLLVARAEKLPFADASLQGVVATSLAGCLPSLTEFLAEICRVLRPEGHAVITFTNRTSLLLRLNHVVTSPQSKSERYQLYSAPVVVRELKRIGFRIEQVKFYNFVLHAGRRLLPPASIARRTDTLCGNRVGQWLGRNFAVVARRAR